MDEAGTYTRHDRRLRAAAAGCEGSGCGTVSSSAPRTAPNGALCLRRRKRRTFPNFRRDRGQSGNLYGTTDEGGNTGLRLRCGPFSSSLPAARNGAICFTGGSDGAPVSRLIEDSNQATCTARLQGGNNSCTDGSLRNRFRSLPPETTLYTFKAAPDGWNARSRSSPTAPVISMARPREGGARAFGSAAGTVFELACRLVAVREYAVSSLLDAYYVTRRDEGIVGAF